MHFIYHLAPTGQAGFVLADTSLTTLTSTEGKIKKKLIEFNVIDCIVALPSHLFSNTQITACIWLINRNRKNDKFRNRENEILFIDASKIGSMPKRKFRVLKDDEITRISETYHHWRNIAGNYKDITGFSHSTNLEDVKENNYNLSPNVYVSPQKQVIDLKIDFNSDTFPKRLNILQDKFLQKTNNILEKWNGKQLLKINVAFELMKVASETELLVQLLFKGLIKKYFLEFDLDDLQEYVYDRIVGKIPNGWSIKKFGDLFEESSLRVKDINYSPSIYSVTNSGIQAREEKFTKKLSKSIMNYKVAYAGDMVFGLSREIPNLDVFMYEVGAFSGAYNVFRPLDFRIGIIVGSIMRLKINEQTDLLKGGAREGRGLNKEKLKKKIFVLPTEEILNQLWTK